MLRNRIYTALGLAGLTVATIFLAPLWLFAIIFAGAASVGVHEWAGFEDATLVLDAQPANQGAAGRAAELADVVLTLQ